MLVLWGDMNCQIYSEPWTLLNFYAPNYDDDSLVQDIFLKVSGGRQIILIGRDFNFCQYLNKTLSLRDKTESRNLTKSAYSLLMVGKASAAIIILRHWKSPYNAGVETSNE